MRCNTFQDAVDEILRAIEKMVAIDPHYLTPEGQLLSGVATAMQRYERLKYPGLGEDKHEG